MNNGIHVQSNMQVMSSCYPDIEDRRCTIYRIQNCFNSLYTVYVRLRTITCSNLPQAQHETKFRRSDTDCWPEPSSHWAEFLETPPYDKTNKMACAPSEDSDQPGHPPSLMRVFAVRMKKAWALSYPMGAQWRLIRLGGCPGWSESSLGAHAILLVCREAAHFKIVEIWSFDRVLHVNLQAKFR